MRPLRLELQGFTAFADKVELDLRDLDLFAITGQTGAGKSSLIDSICYALYGRVPRVGADIKDCIRPAGDPKLDRMYVTLEFQAGAEEYRVFRETKRIGQPNVRLERCSAGDWEALAHGAAEVTKRVESVVGLTYDAFTRSVLLPQGQFQEFLVGSAEKRREVLEKLLRTDVYGRMQKRAGEIVNQKKFELQKMQSMLDQVFAGATAENLASAEDELAVVRRESEVLRDQAPLWQEALKLAQANAALAQAAARAGQQRAATLRQVEAARLSLSGADSILNKLAEAAEDIRGRIDANAFDADLLTALTSGANLALAAEASRKRAAEAAAAVEEREKELQTAEASEKNAAAALETAAAARDAAQHAVLQAQRRDLAATLQGGLSLGDTCPVCGGKVESLPAIAAPELARAEAALSDAAARHRSAGSAHLDAAKALTAAATALQSARENREQRAREAASDGRKLEEALPGIDDRSSATLQVALKVQREAREERLKLNKALQEAEAALTAKQKAVEAARGDLAGRESLLALQEETLSAAEVEASKSADALEAFVRARSLDALQDVIERGASAEEAARDELERLNQRQADLQKEIGRLEMLVDTIKDNIEKAKDVREGLAAVDAEMNVAHDLWQMLGALKFQAFVQAEALRLLAGAGSERLQTLSGGRYRFCISDSGRDFEVVDQWNADDTRSVRTLSGGETFLASLSLALALAESMPALAADRTVALDAIFLDEGFGSLDPEALDRAADALDSLRDGTRMVCVVTHLQELARRMPARIVVEKSESGSHASIAT